MRHPLCHPEISREICEQKASGFVSNPRSSLDVRTASAQSAICSEVRALTTLSPKSTEGHRGAPGAGARAQRSGRRCSADSLCDLGSGSGSLDRLSLSVN